MRHIRYRSCGKTNPFEFYGRDQAPLSVSEKARHIIAPLIFAGISAYFVAASQGYDPLQVFDVSAAQEGSLERIILE